MVKEAKYIKVDISNKVVLLKELTQPILMIVSLPTRP